MTTQTAVHQRITDIPRVLTIAGSDSSGGAGIEADLKSIAAQGGYGVAAITALTAQNTRGVRSVHIPPASFLTEQLDAVSDDVVIDAVKIGMLGDAAIVAAVSAWLDRVQPPHVVLDPVMVATSGDRLLDAAAESSVLALAHQARVITPNVPELGVLASAPAAKSWNEALAQANAVSASTNAVVLLKGGHMPDEIVRDALVDASGTRVPGGVFEVESPRVHTKNTHGTGCTLSSALATRLGAGDDLPHALSTVKAWLTRALQSSDRLQVGHGHGPVNHFVDLWG